MKLSSISRKCIIALYILAPSVCIAATDDNQQEKLPVMKITINGNIAKDMKYTTVPCSLPTRQGKWWS